MKKKLSRVERFEVGDFLTDAQPRNSIKMIWHALGCLRVLPKYF